MVEPLDLDARLPAPTASSPRSVRDRTRAMRTSRRSGTERDLEPGIGWASMEHVHDYVRDRVRGGTHRVLRGDGGVVHDARRIFAGATRLRRFAAVRERSFDGRLIDRRRAAH